MVTFSNENPVQANVYFDDLNITRQTAVEQLNDYYPFGLEQIDSYGSNMKKLESFGVKARSMMHILNWG
jgi:hypothetical protein